MIKKFNENWNSFEDFIEKNSDTEPHHIKPEVGEKFEDVARRARDVAIKTNSIIFFSFNDIDLHTNKYNQIRELYDEYRKKLSEKTNSDSHIQDWKKYWDEKTKDDSFEMDTIADYAKRKGLSYDAAKTIIELKDDQGKEIKNVKFDNKHGTTEIIGLPSGQVIYMNRKQINYFIARKLLRFIKTWKKPITGGFIPIKLDRYCFEDKFFENIMDMMETITW